jgi:YidC/Oxa1 family membrane protein insertase
VEKRVVNAAVRSILILMVWGWLFPPPPPAPPPVEPSRAEAVAVDEAAQALEAPPPETPVAGLAEQGASPVEADAVQTIDVATDLYEVVLTNHGARAVSWKLREYTSSDGAPLELLPRFSGAEPQTLAFALDEPQLERRLAEARYTVEREEVPAGEGLGAGERIRFEWSDGRGLAARKTLTFRDGSYLVGVEAEVIEGGRPVPLRLALGPGFGAQDPRGQIGTYYYASTTVWNRAGRVERLKPRKTAKEPGSFVADVRWAGLEDQYFAALVLPGAGADSVAWRPVADLQPIVTEDASAEQEPVVEPLVAVSPSGEGALLYVGPKKYTLLREMGHDLEAVVWFSSNALLAWIARFIFLALLWIHDHTIPNYGLAILLSTFLLRLLLFPVNQYSMVSMKKTQLQMTRLQPKIKAIRTKFSKKKDAESRGAMNQELMDLYRREGINPAGGLAGCLPLLAQLPILIAFYNMLTVAIELRGAPFFGWIRDLSHPDPYWVLPLLMGAAMFLQQKMAMSKVTDPVQQQQQKIMMIMPLVFTYVCLQMPSGMVLYWFVNNLLGMGQQWLVNRHTARLEAAAQKA